MNDSDTPGRQLHAQGNMTSAERLERIESLLEGLIARLAVGDTSIATISLRLRALEIVVYGACGLGLMALAYALLAIVVHQGAAK